MPSEIRQSSLGQLPAITMEFFRLRDLLQAKDWQAVDEETATCMMRVTEGKRVTFTLQPQDLATFPCDALWGLPSFW